MGWNDISYNNDPNLVNQVETPFLHELASAGVILEKFYTFADCTPSRAALLTGVHPITSGMYMDTIKYDSEWSLDVSYQLIPQYLARANYTSQMVGKWDIGHYTKALTPTKRGFDSFLGFYGSSIEYYSHSVTQTQYCQTDDCKVWLNKCRGAALHDFHDDLSNLRTSNYSTDVFEQRAELLLARHMAATPDAPLFLYLAHHAPHSPHEASNDTYTYFSDKFLADKDGTTGRKERASFAACVNELDDAMRSLVEKMEELGMYENSFMWFLSDNGAMPGVLGGGSNWPLRGGKFLPYEGGIRVPSFVHSPLMPMARRGSTLTELVHVTDVLPTLLELALGEKAQELTATLDGISALPSIWSAEDSQRTSILAHATVADTDERSHWYGAYIEKEWKVVVNSSAATWYNPDSFEYARAAGTYQEPSYYEALAMAGDATFDYFFNESALFNLDDDPYEMTDLKHVHGEKFRSLTNTFFKLVSEAAEAQYHCGCNCKAVGCAELYKLFYENECFVYPWNEGIQITDDDDLVSPPTAEPTHGPKSQAHGRPTAAPTRRGGSAAGSGSGSGSGFSSGSGDRDGEVLLKGH